MLLIDSDQNPVLINHNICQAYFEDQVGLNEIVMVKVI